MIVDGSGSPGFRGSVAVRGDTLSIVRGDSAHIHADRVVDAEGSIVAPGFIDMHSHSGLFLLEDGTNEPKVRQGVTTELIGVDGNSYAPFVHSSDLKAFVRLNSGLDGRPTIAYDWSTVQSLLSRFDGSTTTNVAMVVGNSALRIASVGWDEVEADDKAMDRMKALLREALQEGAFGLSTGLDYPPGSYASTSELSKLSEVASRAGGIYHTHVRYQLGDRFLDPFREAITIGREGGCPVHITHMYRRSTYPGGATAMLDLLDVAEREGVELTFDLYPYPYSSTRLLILIPIALQAGGPDRILERLSDRRTRAEIREAIDTRALAYGGDNVWASIHLNGFSRPEHSEYEGRTIAEIVALRNQHPADVVCDLLVSEDLAINEVAVTGDESTIPQFLKHRGSMVGTDSVFIGQRPSPRTYGSFARILEEYVHAERLMELPEAIRKMTSFPAQRLGLQRRGLLRDGMVADIVVFDLRKVRACASFEQPRRHAEGITHVIVNGSMIMEEGVLTEARPGRALRRGRD